MTHSVPARRSTDPTPRAGSVTARAGTTAPSGPITKRSSSAFGLTARVTTQRRPLALRSPPLPPSALVSAALVSAAVVSIASSIRPLGHALLCLPVRPVPFPSPDRSSIRTSIRRLVPDPVGAGRHGPHLAPL